MSLTEQQYIQWLNQGWKGMMTEKHEQMLADANDGLLRFEKLLDERLTNTSFDSMEEVNTGTFEDFSKRRLSVEKQGHVRDVDNIYAPGTNNTTLCDNKGCINKYSRYLSTGGKFCEECIRLISFNDAMGTVR